MSRVTLSGSRGTPRTCGEHAVCLGLASRNSKKEAVSPKATNLALPHAGGRVAAGTAVLAGVLATAHSTRELTRRTRGGQSGAFLGGELAVSWDSKDILKDPLSV